LIVDTIALTKGLKTTFNKAFKAAPAPRYGGLVLKTTSKSNSETYGWLGAPPPMREWVGERYVASMEDYSYEIINKDFESTVAVDRNEIEDDQVGMIKPRIMELAVRAKAYPDILISDLVIASLSGLAYDSAALCSNRTAPNDNLLAGAGVTEANLLTGLAAARAAMRAFTDDQGEVMNIVGDTVICHPGEEVFFMKILKSTTSVGATGAGEFNFWRDQLKMVIVDARLSDDNDWYLCAGGYALKPFILQTRKSPQFVALDKKDDEQVFMRKKLLYGVDMRANAGYGLFRYIVQTVNA